MKFTLRKKVAAAVAVAGLVGAGSAAFAYFSSAGDGSGSGTVGTSVNFTVATDTATGASLLPGSGSQLIKYRVTNPAAFSQNLTDVAISVANANGTTWNSVAGCSASDFSINGAGAGVTAHDTSLAGVIAATTTTADGTITLTMVESNGDQSGCKNATVPLYLHAT